MGGGCCFFYSFRGSLRTLIPFETEHEIDGQREQEQRRDSGFRELNYLKLGKAKNQLESPLFGICRGWSGFYLLRSHQASGN